MKQDAWRERRVCLARVLGAALDALSWVHCVIRDWNVAETARKGPGEARYARRERDRWREAATARLSRGGPGLRRGRIVPQPPRYSLVRSAMRRLTKSYLSSMIGSSVLISSRCRTCLWPAGRMGWRSSAGAEGRGDGPRARTGAA